jgi:hypothetical protein
MRMFEWCRSAIGDSLLGKDEEEEGRAAAVVFVFLEGKKTATTKKKTTAKTTHDINTNLSVLGRVDLKFLFSSETCTFFGRITGVVVYMTR